MRRLYLLDAVRTMSTQMVVVAANRKEAMAIGNDCAEEALADVIEDEIEVDYLVELVKPKEAALHDVPLDDCPWGGESDETIGEIFEADDFRRPGPDEQPLDAPGQRFLLPDEQPNRRDA